MDTVLNTDPPTLEVGPIDLPPFVHPTSYRTMLSLCCVITSYHTMLCLCGVMTSYHTMLSLCYVMFSYHTMLYLCCVMTSYHTKLSLCYVMFSYHTMLYLCCVMTSYHTISETSHRIILCSSVYLSLILSTLLLQIFASTNFRVDLFSRIAVPCISLGFIFAILRFHRNSRILIFANERNGLNLRY